MSRRAVYDVVPSFTIRLPNPAPRVTAVKPSRLFPPPRDNAHRFLRMALLRSAMLVRASAGLARGVTSHGSALRSARGIPAPRFFSRPAVKAGQLRKQLVAVKEAIGRVENMHRSNAENLIAEVPVIEVEGSVAVCDGGGGALGHPLEYIQLNMVHEGEENVCKYCGLRFRMKPGSGHH